MRSLTVLLPEPEAVRQIKSQSAITKFCILALLTVHGYDTEFYTASKNEAQAVQLATYVHAGGGTLIGGGIMLMGGGMFTGWPGGGGGAIIGTGTGTPPVGGASANSWCGRSACDSGFCAASRRSAPHTNTAHAAFCTVTLEHL